MIIDGRISENSSMVWTDNEHISFSWVEVNGAPAYLGTFIERDGYTLIWAKDGIEHSIYFETDLPWKRFIKSPNKSTDSRTTL